MKEFKEFKVIEHFGTFYRFKLDVTISVAKMFGLF